MKNLVKLVIKKLKQHAAYCLHMFEPTKTVFSASALLKAAKISESKKIAPFFACIEDENGHLYWTKPDGSVLKDLKANMGASEWMDGR